jgi:hypothetical protein
VVEETGIVLSGGSSGIDPGFRVARMADGRFLASARWEQGVLLVFDPEGIFLDRIGQFGEGPEESGSVGALVPSQAGGIHVFHGNGRWSRVDPSLDIVPVGRHPALALATQVNTAVLNDSLVAVLDPLVPEVPASGQILRMEEDQVALAATFQTGTGSEAQWMGLLPPVAVSGDGTSFWTGPWLSAPDTYRMEKRDRSGHLLRTLERSHPWTLPEPDSRAVERTSITLSPFGTSRVLVGFGIPANGAGEPERVYEVLDLERGEIVSSGSRILAEPASRLTFVGALPESPSGSLAYVIRSHGGAAPEIHISALSLSPGPTQVEGSCS